jgi:flavin-binding protein dodecin
MMLSGKCRLDTRNMEGTMQDTGKTYKLIELVGVSERSTEDAIQNALAQASQTLKGLAWFEVKEMRGLIEDGKVNQFQVTLKIGFRILSESELSRD